jgi:hypothetical protein
MFITDKPFLYATTIDHVADIITARASHEGCSEEGLSVLNSMGEYGNGLCIAASIGSRTMVSCCLLSINITANQLESSRLYNCPSMDPGSSLPHGCCDGSAIRIRSQVSMRCLLWRSFEITGFGWPPEYQRPIRSHDVGQTPRSLVRIGLCGQKRNQRRSHPCPRKDWLLRLPRIHHYDLIICHGCTRTRRIEGSQRWFLLDLVTR